MPGHLLRGGERRGLRSGSGGAHRPGGAEEGPPGVRPPPHDHGRRGGRGLGEQLEGLLQAHGDRGAPDGGPGVGGGQERGPGDGAPQPRPHLRHREPRHHAALPHGPGKMRAARYADAGPGVRERDIIHRLPAPGR